MAAETQLVVDKKEQLEKIQEYALPEEKVLAVLDMKGGGTGFIGLTDKRIIFFDKAFLGKRKAMVSIPYRAITSVASEDDTSHFRPGFFTSSRIIVKAGSDIHEFEFRGSDRAHIAYQIIVGHM